jgi:hypothetical protein
MKLIKAYVDRMVEEVEDAKTYAECYIEQKAKGNMAEANKYREMSGDELKHASYIHEFAVKDIAELEKVYTPPVEMLDKWDHAHKEYVERAAWVRQMLSM